MGSGCFQGVFAIGSVNLKSLDRSVDIRRVTVLFACALGAVGLLIGSFLNVVIWRVPRGESVVRPASACPHCGARIKAYDNIPVLSWLILHGKCRGCGEPISWRYPLVEATTGVLFAATTWWLGPVWHLPAFLYLVAISVALTMIDIDVKRLPNAIVLPSYLVGAGLLSAAGWLEGDLSALVRAAIGMVALYLFYFVVCLLYPAGMGFGDVKLAGVIGLYLGFLGWRELVVGAFMAFLVGGVAGLALIARGHRKLRIPFGPYMLVGAWVGVLLGAPLANWYLQITQLA